MIRYETNSKKVLPGQTFIAIKGNTVDGHDYIKEAIKNGASLIITEKPVKYSVPSIKVPSTKEYLKNVLVNNYAHQFKDMKIIGVTGTNGKTTTCYLTYQFLNKLGYKAAYIGTIGFYLDGFKKPLPNTTPDILNIYNLLMEAKANNCEYVVMEVSSHSLDEERIKGLKLDIAAFTNLTQDHLDYHKTMDNYLKSKLKIIDYIKSDGSLIVNNDDFYAKEFINRFNNVTTIGYKNNSDFRIINDRCSQTDTLINFNKDNQKYYVTTNLISKFNVYNYLTCFAILNKLGIDEKTIINETKDIYPPKGRCEIIKAGKGICVIDYAHTPDAVLKVIKCFNELKENQIITIMGCGGDRDPIKRPIIGDICCKLSNHVIFTNDNPRTEDPKKIMNDITTNLKYENFEIIYDRAEAIYQGINMMEENDILLILGKGHENYQIIGHEKIHYDDHEVVEKWLKENYPLQKKYIN
ncbi:MAG: UDP-N-acetylmuramoyl-L-alanyl-D-glutamate--2,6-diaminopimelate ligase [Bacilli bacterium]|nr:UDP-N-acetylmuramoyl-L-alanyl-D-glutamate--2,6-diaminopimelate ligase [Bacilli bacterium]